ncbi:hypothetical protein LXL04_012696 [Taraxacum kok-saghyz]
MTRCKFNQIPNLVVFHGLNFAVHRLFPLSCLRASHGFFVASRLIQVDQRFIADERVPSSSNVETIKLWRLANPRSSSKSGVPARCAGDSLFDEWFRFGKPSDQKFLFEKTYLHNVALTTYFRLMVSSRKTGRPTTKCNLDFAQKQEPHIIFPIMPPDQKKNRPYLISIQTLSNGGKRHLSQAPSREEKGRLKSGWQTRQAS